ncbi:MAG: ComEC family competence protein, partial [Pseudomonadales bacterium]|nr:ComEC family competence protein [Pseudomonadales bacterium]
MRLYLTGYCLGIAVVSLFPVLDRSLLTMSLAVVLCGALLALRSRSKQIISLLLGVTCGLVWHWIWAVQHTDNRLPPQWEGRDFSVQGQVIGLPTTTSQGQSFDFLIQQSKFEGLRGKLQLSTFPGEQQIQVVAGEVWRLQVRLKQVHGHSNPGGFDREANLFRQGVIATGYVRESAGNTLLTTNRWSIAYWRQALLTKLQPHFHAIGLAADHQGMMIALILGERSQLSAADWNLFSATGTNHLFVISGLHIGLVTLLCFRISRVFAAYLLSLPLINRRCYPAQTCAALIA